MSRWYIIHAYSGFENKVKDAILSEATRLGLETQVEAVEVPTEKVTEIRRGKKVTSDRKFFPGYVLAKLAMNDQVYHLVKNTPKVTGFLGPGGKPQAITEAEAARILSTKEEAASAAPKQKVSVDYEIGDAVKVLEDGALPSRQGYDLVLSGRLKKLPDGRVIACRALGVEAPPECVISAQFDRVRIQTPDGKSTLGEWST